MTTNSSPSAESRLQVFIAYAPEDEGLRKRLEAYLTGLQREGLIQTWHDRQIDAGAEWSREIETHLESADIILLLVSQDFIASEYCWDVLVKKAMERHKAGFARVIPIILSPADWQHTRFSKLQALPKGARPVTKWEDPDDAWLDVNKGLRRAIAQRTPSPAPVPAPRPARNLGRVLRVLAALVGLTFLIIVGLVQMIGRGGTSIPTPAATEPNRTQAQITAASASAISSTRSFERVAVSSAQAAPQAKATASEQVTPTPSVNPTLPDAVADVVTRGYFSCALMRSGKVRCWGSNSYGELGDGTRASRVVPQDVVGIERATAIASGAYHTCALLANGAVKCWGRNYVGELGNGTLDDSPLPISVTGLGSGVAQVSANGDLTCAVTTEGAAKCWGLNNEGQVGDGTQTDRSVPSPVYGLATGIASIAAGYMHSCAVLDSESGVVCWGKNSDGQLGDGTTTPHLTPAPVAGLAGKVRSIAVGGGHTCALLLSGSVQCWGANYFGELGTGTSIGSLVPMNTVGLSGTVIQLSTLSDHTCALLSSGEMRCWGRNDKGQLGNGSGGNQNIPTAVAGLSSEVIRMVAGLEGSCAIMKSGTLRCWGGNAYGQVGDGTLATRYVPIEVVGLMAQATPGH